MFLCLFQCDFFTDITCVCRLHRSVLRRGFAEMFFCWGGGGLRNQTWRRPFMPCTQADATQRTTTETGPEDPAQGLQGPETMNKINKCQFDQIIKRRNYKRSLLKCVDAMARKKVLRCTALPSSESVTVDRTLPQEIMTSRKDHAQRRPRGAGGRFVNN